MISIPGLSVATAMERLMNNEKLYRTILKRFSKSQKSCSLEVIREKLKTGNEQAAKRCAHNMKALCGNIGADELFSLFESLEWKIHHNKREELEPILVLISDKLNEINAAISYFFDNYAAVDSACREHKLFSEISVTLNKMLMDFDTEAEFFVEEHKDMLSKAIPEYYPALKDSVESYDFDEALNIWETAVTIHE